MLTLTLRHNEQVNLGDNLLEIISIYEECIYIEYNKQQHKILKDQTITLGTSTIQYKRTRKHKGVVIGLSSPQKILRRKDHV